MIAELINLFTHSECNKKIANLRDVASESAQQIKALHRQLVDAQSNIHEQKSIYDFQTAVLEKKIEELQEGIAKAKAKRKFARSRMHSKDLPKKDEDNGSPRATTHKRD